MRKLIFAAVASAAVVFCAPFAVGSADAQTVVIKKNSGHYHGYRHAPRRNVVVIKDRRHYGWDRRHYGWRNHQHVRGRGHMHHNHGTVGVSVR